MRFVLFLLLLVQTVAAGPLVKEFFDGDFVEDPQAFDFVERWDTFVIRQDPGTTFQVASSFGGRDSSFTVTDIFRRIEMTFPSTSAGESNFVIVGQVAQHLVWDPATDGAIGMMEFAFDLRAINSSGFSGSGIVGAFFRPILLQDGIVYRASTSVFQVQSPNSGQWTPTDAPASFVFASLADWTRNGAAPNLSESGSLIRFGFEAALSAGCPSTSTSGCTSASSANGVDNFFVRVTGVADQEPPDPSAIPEPGTMLLLSAGLLGIVAVRRRWQA